jgi:hypothetical protein
MASAVGSHPSITSDRSIGPMKDPNGKIILSVNRCTDLPQPRDRALPDDFCAAHNGPYGVPQLCPFCPSEAITGLPVLTIQ